MKAIIFTVILIISGLALLDSQPKPQEINYDTVSTPDSLEYDWVNDKYLTPSMRDTMTYTGGKWYGNSNLPKLKAKEKKPKWIRGAGKHYKKSKEPQLTEDDVIDIIERY